MSKIDPRLIHEEVIRGIRLFFVDRGFQEFTLAILHPSLPLEPNIHAFTTNWCTPKGNKSLYLSTSPENGLKKIMARGRDKCFALTKSFRNIEGIGPLHQPEFLMLEWYLSRASYRNIMKMSQKLILYLKNYIDTYLDRARSTTLSYQSHKIELSGNWPIYSLIDLYARYPHISLASTLTDETMAVQAQKMGYSVTKENTFDQLFDQIFLNEIAPNLPLSPYFLTDFPTRISPLCLPQKSNPDFAERFELFIGGIEIGNGNTENTNVTSVNNSFVEEQIRRKRKKLEIPPPDAEFLEALNLLKNIPYAGMGIGVERLSMLLSDSPNINDVLYFPLDDMINNKD